MHAWQARLVCLPVYPARRKRSHLANRWRCCRVRRPLTSDCRTENTAQPKNETQNKTIGHKAEGWWRRAGGNTSWHSEWDLFSLRETHSERLRAVDSAQPKLPSLPSPSSPTIRRRFLRAFRDILVVCNRFAYLMFIYFTIAVNLLPHSRTHTRTQWHSSTTGRACGAKENIQINFHRLYVSGLISRWMKKRIQQSWSGANWFASLRSVRFYTFGGT